MSEIKDQALEKFFEKHHFLDILDILMTTISIQNRENREMGLCLSKLTQADDRVCQMTGRVLDKGDVYRFEMKPYERKVLRKAGDLHNDFKEMANGISTSKQETNKRS